MSWGCWEELPTILGPGPVLAITTIGPGPVLAISTTTSYQLPASYQPHAACSGGHLPLPIDYRRQRTRSGTPSPSARCCHLLTAKLRTRHEAKCVRSRRDCHLVAAGSACTAAHVLRSWPLSSRSCGRGATKAVWQMGASTCTEHAQQKQTSE